MKKRFFGFLLLILSLHAKKAPLHHFIEVAPEDEIQSPWLTGPLLAPSSITIPPGHYNIEPYLYFVANTGAYNQDWKAVKAESTRWTNYFQPTLEFGLNRFMDIFFDPTLNYNFTEGAGKWSLGDVPIGLDFQLWKRGQKVTDWISALKFSLRETCPLGKYRNLNPKKLGTDIGGSGSWQTALDLVWGNLFYLGRHKFLVSRLSFAYNIPAPTHVKNLNAYGGGEGTRGTVYPAQSFQLDCSVELTLTQNWAFACDFLGIWAGNTRFKGTTLASNTHPTATQFSLAPALEYNWSGNLGIIFGSWFTFAGRNSTRFVSGVFALNYYN